jgi:DNA-binding GntR family transcriptional regulator
VRPEGVAISLPLTHQVVARLAGATRPSVSNALKRLEQEGVISKHPGGGFVLHGDPPDLARAGERRRARRFSSHSPPRKPADSSERRRVA